MSNVRWEPWLMDEEGRRVTRLLIMPTCHTINDIQKFFKNLSITHPTLVGQRIEFEEIIDGPVRVFVPGRRDT